MELSVSNPGLSDAKAHALSATDTTSLMCKQMKLLGK